MCVYVKAHAEGRVEGAPGDEKDMQSKGDKDRGPKRTDRFDDTACVYGCVCLCAFFSSSLRFVSTPPSCCGFLFALICFSTFRSVAVTLAEPHTRCFKR